jgi:hypothetical protein
MSLRATLRVAAAVAVLFGYLVYDLMKGLEL